MRDYIFFYLNGRPTEVRGDRASMMLSDFLRYDRALTGTKVVCAEGDCGACSILRRTPLDEAKPFEPVNACIATVSQMDGSSLVTVEALATEEALSPVQQAMVTCHGSQCGFCTPGFVMALTGLVEKKIAIKSKAAIDEREAKNYLTGNLCRCTGYQPILDSASAISIEKCESLSPKFYSSAIQKQLKAIVAEPVSIQSPEYRFFAPTKSTEVSKYLAKQVGARLLGAGTDLGVLVNKHKLRYENVVSLHLVPELYRVEAKRSRMRVGSRVTLAVLRRSVEKSIPELARFLDIFASPQIKNVATLVGNLVNASPIADTPPFLLVAGTVVVAVGPKGKREIPIESFYLDYRKTALKPGEWVSGVEFDVPSAGESLRLRKTSQRKDLDISNVNAAFRYFPATKETRIALGGVAATPLRLKKTEAFLKGKKLSLDLFPGAVKKMQEEISPLSDLRGSAAFRRVLVENLFEEFLTEETR